MSTSQRRRIMLLAVGILCLGGCARPGGKVVIKGSDTMVGLGQRWAEEFMRAHPEVAVSVTGGGSGTGLAALIDGTCDIAQASRPIKPGEIQKARAQGREPVEVIVAWDGVAVIVNRANPVSKLTLPQLSDLYQGKITNWRQLGGPNAPVVLLARETSSGTHVFFKEHVLQLNGKRPQADYATSAILLTSSQAIHDEVATNPNAVGYVGLGYVDKAVKTVAVAEREGGPYTSPSLDNVVSRRYPISRPLFNYVCGEPSGAIKQYLDFVLSPQGQAIVKEVGFVPCPQTNVGHTGGLRTYPPGQ